MCWDVLGRSEWSRPGQLEQLRWNDHTVSVFDGVTGHIGLGPGSGPAQLHLPRDVFKSFVSKALSIIRLFVSIKMKETIFSLSQFLFKLLRQQTKQA